MARLMLLLFVINVALVATALISCLSADSEDIRALPKIAWVFIILLFAPVGPIAWFIAGRPVPAARTDAWGPGRGAPPAPRPHRPVAPDDDPEFLAGLAKQQRDDENLFKRWEEDLRRREEELRREEERRRPDGDQAPEG